MQSFVNLHKPDLAPGRMGSTEADKLLRAEAKGMAPMAKAHDCRLTLKLESGSARIRGSAEALGMICRNLLHNAVRHGDRGKPITISTRLDGPAWHLSVANSGQMSEEAASHVWEPYYHNRDSRVRGSHIGLPSSLRLAQAYGATLDLANRPHGRVLATLIWPLAQGENPD